ncbi:FGGY-family carbohydrate kinase [Microbacterium sp.]|uniref:FGGY-family carbohydrate kinase n=1 Tax=Microbacterium sp. TaxID=51671 RepID=UPI003F70F78F
MTQDVWVGIDLGTQSVRVSAVSGRGVELAAAAEPLRSVRDGERHEQDPAHWLAATTQALRHAIAALPPHAFPRAVAVSGTSGTLVAVDALTGAPRGMGVMYDDQRGSEYLPVVRDAGAAVWSRLGYRMQASWGLPKLMRMLRDGVAAPGTVIAHQPDVITAMLAGRLLPSDLSSALKTGADLDAVRWPEEVFAALGVAPSAVNSLAESGSVIGNVDAAGSEATGLPEGCLIVAGMTDGCAAQIAAGALSPGYWNSVLGTTLVLKGAASARHVDSTGAVYAHRAPFGSGWYPGGASSTGAGAISALLPGRDIDALTAALDVDAPPPVSYPLVGRGERFPFVAPDAVGLLPDGDDLATFAAVLYGVAYVERLAFDLLQLTGYDTDGQILLTGGGSRNRIWNQLRADVLQREVAPAAHGEGAVGMAMLAAAGALAVADAHDANPLQTVARRMVPAAQPLSPRSRRRAAIAEGYGNFIAHLSQRGWITDDLRSAALIGLDS